MMEILEWWTLSEVQKRIADGMDDLETAKEFILDVILPFAERIATNPKIWIGGLLGLAVIMTAVTKRNGG